MTDERVEVYCKLDRLHRASPRHIVHNVDFYGFLDR